MCLKSFFLFSLSFPPAFSLLLVFLHSSSISPFFSSSPFFSIPPPYLFLSMKSWHVAQSSFEFSVLILSPKRAACKDVCHPPVFLSLIKYRVIRYSAESLLWNPQQPILVQELTDVNALGRCTHSRLIQIPVSLKLGEELKGQEIKIKAEKIILRPHLQKYASS